MFKSNIKKIMRDIDKFIDTKSKDTEEALIEVGLRGVAIVKPLTPVDSGRLRNSMSYVTKNKRSGEGVDNLKPTNDKKVVYVGTNVIYGPKVEYVGRSKGYMQNAFNLWKPIATKIFMDILGRGLKS